jgi:RimJ/RimL family protein N-acetyltransferase
VLPRAFETPRLIARMPEAADAARLFVSYTQRPEVCRFMIWRPHKHISETEAFVSECLVAIESGERLPFVLCERGKPLRPIGMLDARLARHTVDIGYVLAPEFWGRGYMPEAIQSLARSALAEPEYFRVQAFCDVENVPSQRALEKAGFLREGRHERFLVHPNVGAEPRPCYMYAKCK